MKLALGHARAYRSSSIGATMQTWMWVLLLFGLVKLPIAALMLWVPCATTSPSRSAATRRPTPPKRTAARRLSRRATEPPPPLAAAPAFPGAARMAPRRSPLPPAPGAGRRPPAGRCGQSGGAEDLLAVALALLAGRLGFGPPLALLQRQVAVHPRLDVGGVLRRSRLRASRTITEAIPTSRTIAAAMPIRIVFEFLFLWSSRCCSSIR